jgi:LysR family transcriptional regulator, glycine cleavage system transcriptional activator
LHAFEACARLSSFNAAALKLSISPSAVRFQIGLLESRLGANLFERQVGRLALTEIGQTFAHQIERPLHNLITASAVAQQAASAAPLALTAPPLLCASSCSTMLSSDGVTRIKFGWMFQTISAICLRRA